MKILKFLGAILLISLVLIVLGLVTWELLALRDPPCSRPEPWLTRPCETLP